MLKRILLAQYWVCWGGGGQLLGVPARPLVRWRIAVVRILIGSRRQSVTRGRPSSIQRWRERCVSERGAHMLACDSEEEPAAAYSVFWSRPITSAPLPGAPHLEAPHLPLCQGESLIWLFLPLFCTLSAYSFPIIKKRKSCFHLIRRWQCRERRRL